MMKSILFFLFIGISVCLSGQQSIKQDTVYSSLILGLYPNISYNEYMIDNISEEKATVFSLEIRPYLAYNLYKNLYLGCSFSYEFFASNFYEKENFIEFGVFTRYIVPFTIDRKFLRRIHFYTELSYYKTNYRIVKDVVRTVEYKTVKIEEDFIISDNLDQSKLSLPIGFAFHASKKLYFDLNWQYIHFINGTSINGFMCGVGYNIGKRK